MAKRAYPANLCTLSAVEQHDIEVDKQRWWLAHQVYYSMSKWQAEQWLAKIDNAAHQDDMARRLKQLAETNQQG